MKLASFFFLSVTAHALALMYPVSFLEPKQTQFIPVLILPSEGESTAGTGEGKASVISRPPGPAKSSARKSSATQHGVESKTNNGPEPQSQLVTMPPDLFQNPNSAMVFMPSKPSESEANGATKNSSAHDGTSNVSGRADGGANGMESSGTGSGPGNGQGRSGNGATLTQARYRETPKPAYPESARQKGREGTVLLRVLVDDQGRAKTIEINQSSGDKSLDRAAGEAIKRWRFIPAHYGDKAVESWIRIPVDFRLADNKP